ncbi:hypothetical protein [Mycobacterium sp.]|uniref:hypothetical protein n=1 Tax=Mycobacterium sp. TaxID=1785 RepID=UPI003C716FE9
MQLSARRCRIRVASFVGDPERRRWEAAFPDHQTVILEGAGHYLQEDAAADVVAAIRAWHT